MGGQDNDDGNTIAYGESVWSHGVTTEAFQVSARLVEEGPEETIAVVVVHKKHLIYISIGVFGVIFVVVGLIVVGVTLSSTSSSQPGITPATSPTPAPTTPAQLAMII